MDTVTMQEIEDRADLAGRELNDPDMCRRYAELAAKDDVPALLAALREAYADQGGDLGLMLRNALRQRILDSGGGLDSTFQRIATMAEDVHIHSLNVSAIRGQGRVVVDVRLMIGDAPVGV